MSNTIGTEYIQIEPSAKGIQGSIEQAISSGSQGFGKSLSGALGTAAKLGTAALAGATTAIGAFGTASVQAGASFDSSMSQVAATMGKSMSELESEVGSVDLAWGDFTGNLREYAQEMGKNTAFSATEAADALNYMALAGYDTQTSMEMLPNVLNLAAAGGMDLARASDMVTDTQTAFGISLERTSQMVDEMAKAASTGNTSVEQLGDAFLTVGGLAQELNGGMVTLADGTTKPVDGVQELEIALTAMANAGVKGTEAGTHMRNMLLKLSSPTSDGAKQMEALGVSVFDTEGNMRSLSDIFGDLSGSLDNLTQEEKIQAISELFNTRDLASAEALLNAVGQDWDSIGASILEADGAAEKMAGTQLDNLTGDVTLFKSALEGAQIAISDQLSPSIREFVQFGTDGLSRMTTAFQEGGLSGAMQEFGSVLSEGLNMIIAEIPQMVDAGIQLIGALGQGITQNAPQILSAFEEIAGMILSSIADLMWQVADSLQNTDWSELSSNMAEKIAGIFDFENGDIGSILYAGARIIENLASGIGEAAPNLLPAAMDAIANFGNFLGQEAPALIDSAVDLVLGLVEGLTNPTSLGNMLTAAIDLIMSLTQGLINNIPKITAALPQIIQNIVDTLVKLAPQLLSAAVEIIVQLQLGLIKNLPTLLKAIPEIITALVTGIFQMSFELIKAGAELIKKAKEGFKSLNPAEWGRDLVDNFVEGIRNSIGKVISAAKEVANTVKDYLGFSEPELGPLSNFHTYAPDMLKLFAQGIEDNTKIVTDAIDQMASDMLSVDASTDIRALVGSDGTQARARAGGNIIFNNSFVINGTNKDTRELAEEISYYLEADWQKVAGALA